jgi:hypothetical protein
VYLGQSIALVSAVGPPLVYLGSVRMRRGHDTCDTAQGSRSARGPIPLHNAVVLDRRGWVIQYTRAAKGLLEELEDLGPGWQGGEGLPLAIWMVASAVRKALMAQSDREEAMVPRLCIKARSGRWLTLQRALTEAKPGQPGGTMIFIEPSRTKGHGLAEDQRLWPNPSRARGS